MASIIPAATYYLQAILQASNSLLSNNFSHLGLFTKSGGGGGGGILTQQRHEQQPRNLFSLTDDDEIYEDYIPTTIDTGWMFFSIAVVISIASIVALPLNIQLGKFVSRKWEEVMTAAAKRRDRARRTDGGLEQIESYDASISIEPYSASFSSSSVDHTKRRRTMWQKIQAAHSQVFLCITDYLIFRWRKSSGKRRRQQRYGRRRERNVRARERQARLSAMRIDVEEQQIGEEEEQGVELSLRWATNNDSVPSTIHVDTNTSSSGVNQSQIELYNGGGNNNNKISTPSCCTLTKIQKTFKFLMSIIRYDNETKRLLQLAIPFTVSGIVYTVLDLVVVAFISHYLGTDAMIAYALVDLVMGTTSEFLGGFIEAVSSLGSMAFGAENYFAVGQYVQLATVLYVVCQMPFFIVWGKYMKDIILLFGFDEVAAEMASKFVWVAMPIHIVGGIHESFADFLEVIEHEAYANIFACVAAIMEVVLIWIGLHFYDADLVLLGLISLGTDVLALVLNLIFCIAMGWLEEYENGLIRSLAFKNRPLLKELLKTAAPLALGSLLAYAEWEVLTVFAAVLGPLEAATWAVLGFVWDVFESTTEAFGDAGEVRVSYQLGKGRPQLARLSSYKCMFMGLAMSIVMSTIFLSLINVLPEFLTTNDAIQDMLRMLFPMIALGNVTMSVGMVCWALVGAQLRYTLATAIATLCSFGITLPLSAIFTIVLNYDLKGLTFGVVVGYVMTAMLLSTVLLMSDWDKLSERIREKVLADEDDDSSSDDSSSSSSSSSSGAEEDEYDSRDKHDEMTRNTAESDVKGGKYEDYDWEELPANIKAAAAVLGYNQQLWDSDTEPEYDEDWKDLTPVQKQAATVLGYNKKTWDRS